MPLFSGIEIPGKPDLDNIRNLDLLPLPMIRRMQRLGFAIDIPYFADLSSQFDREMRVLQREISDYIPIDRLEDFTNKAVQAEEGAEGGEGYGGINANSAEQIGTLLFDVLNIGRGYELKQTKGGKRLSTDKKQLTKIQFEHPVVAKVLAYKERAKLKSTYSDALPKLARRHPRSVGSSVCPVCEMRHEHETWRVHTEIVTTRTETGRLASRKPNLQNIPQRSALGEKIRAGFIASPGNVLVSVDFSQIELRVMAHCANVKSMIQVYENDGDIHEQTCLDCFGLDSVDQIDKIRHRIPAKTANFLTGYGGSAKALLEQLGLAFSTLIAEGKLDKIPEWLDLEWCERFIANWFEVRPEIRDYMELQAYRARRYGMVWTMFGRPRLTPEMQSFHTWIRAAGLRQAGNQPIQGCAADQMKLTMAAVEEGLMEYEEAGVWCRPILPVHDQLLVETGVEDGEEVLGMMMAKFDNVMWDQERREHRFRVPIKSDGGMMERWQK